MIFCFQLPKKYLLLLYTVFFILVKFIGTNFIFTMYINMLQTIDSVISRSQLAVTVEVEVERVNVSMTWSQEAMS